MPGKPLPQRTYRVAGPTWDAQGALQLRREGAAWILPYIKDQVRARPGLDLHLEPGLEIHQVMGSKLCMQIRAPNKTGRLTSV